MQTNRAARRAPIQTHEGGPAVHITASQALRRSVMSCLLWEREFYEDGDEIAKRIAMLVPHAGPVETSKIAVEAREIGNLRHVPLLLASLMAKHFSGHTLVRETIARVVQRADELTELLAIHAKTNGVEPGAVRRVLGSQMKRGLGRAFQKFDEYQIAKYNRDGAIKLRDAYFMIHPRAFDRAQHRLWKRMIDDELKVPDTWEVALSGGADKRETFTRLIEEGKIGYLALLRNLRNMEKAGVDRQTVIDAITARRGARRVLPFRYVAAARACPQFEPAIDAALLESIAEMPVLPNRTVVMVDVSTSMNARLSAKSDLTRRDAAATLASVIHGDVRMFAFSESLTEVPARRGMAGVEAINAVPRGGTKLFDAVDQINRTVPYDRLIVITDEQAENWTPMYEQSAIRKLPAPNGLGYMINVASAKNGVGYGQTWTHIDGFSEGVLRFVHQYEQDDR